MSEIVTARGSTWRFVAVLLGGLAILSLVPYLLYRASVLPIRVIFESHRDHTALSLPDGQVLIVGGNDGSGIERYDPTRERWLQLGGLDQRSYGVTATLLADGRVLVIGKRFSEPQFFRLYDPATGDWSEVPPGPVDYYQHTSTLLPDGTILFAGGGSKNGTSSAARYDPATNQCLPTASMASPRTGHTATLLADGTVLVTGGDPEQAIPKGLASAERFDPLANRWTSVESMARPRYGHTATLLPDGRVLVVDGNSSSLAGSAVQFDARTGRWGTAGGITVQQLWWLFGLLPLYMVAFVLVCLVAILFDSTRWGSWLCTNARLHNLTLPISRQAKISLLWMYGGILCGCLAILLQALSNTSLWPYPRSPFPLLFFILALQFVCLGLFLATRKALAPLTPPSVSSLAT